MAISNLQGGQIVGEENQASLGSGNVFPDTHIKLISDHTSFDVVWNNLQHTTYKGKPITSLKEHFDVYKNVTSNKNATNNFDDVNGDPSLKGYSIHISHDPTKGFNQFGLTTTFVGQYYYADGSPVNFEKGNAYLSVGSLDNYQNGLKQYSREEAIVNSGGRAIGLAGSSVTAHGNKLYADNPNAIPDNDLKPGGSQSWDGYNPQHQFKGQYNASQWDYNGSPLQFYGAGLVELNGSQFSVTATESDEGIPDGASFRNWEWFNMTAVLPKTQEPQLKPSEIHYHYNQTENHYYDSRIIFSIIFWLSLSANSLTMCTYVCCVVIVLAWPNRLATLGIDTPSYNKSDA